MNKNVTYAASDDEAILQNWLNAQVYNNEPKFYTFKYVNGDVNYDACFMKVVLPEGTSNYPRIAYKYNTSGAVSFIYQDEDYETPLKLNLSVVMETDAEGKENRRSVLKRQAANNFNADEKNKFGYLLEVAGNMSSDEFEGKKIIFTATFTNKAEEEISKEIVIADDWKYNQMFSTINQEDIEESWFTKILKWIQDIMGELIGWFESLINKVFIALADGVFAAICAAVGERVTLDSIIFGRTEKLSINFWDGEDAEDTKTQSLDPNVKLEEPKSNSVKSVLYDVVNRWYSIFFGIAVLVYMIALLFIGVKVVLTSTGESKAKYKEVFQSWITGVIILCLFPYVMKYTVLLNNALLEMIGTDLDAAQGESGKLTPTPEISETQLESSSASFGDENFITSIKGAPFVAGPGARQDLMLYIRDLAGNLGKLSLTFVYYVMLGELIVILFVYYKRVFMMAFLITIFPIIAMMYIVQKINASNSAAFTTWFKEYLILVLTQSFHAATYVVVVNAGITAYIESDNWLFMLLCVIFLFQGEKILRTIFGMKSAANTIGDLATAGVAAIGAAKMAKTVLGGDKQKEDKDEKDLGEAKERLEQGANGGGATGRSSGGTQSGNSGGGSGSGSGSGSGGGSDADEEESDLPQEINRDPAANFEQAKDFVMTQALQKKINTKRGRGVVSRAAKTAGFATKVFSAGIGAAVGAATGDASKAIAGAGAGAAVGSGIGKIATAPIRGVCNKFKGQRLKRKIMSGKMDDEFRKLGFDLDNMDSETQKLFREGLAAYAKGATEGGSSKGELKMLNKMAKIDKKNSKR